MYFLYIPPLWVGDWAQRCRPQFEKVRSGKSKNSGPSRNFTVKELQGVQRLGPLIAKGNIIIEPP